MKQILQNVGSGETTLVDIPAPAVKPGHLLIRTRRSLVSIGTEKMLIDFGRSSWWQKARRQPDKVEQLVDKAKTDGVLPAIEAVRAKLDQPIALGYCNVGEVMGLGAGTDLSGFAVGQRVVSNGPHAEVVCVPKNLCALVPDEVSDEHAVFTVIGAIGLQGVRLLQPTLGEYIVVTGLGMIGLMAVQILRAHGCRVLGIDFDPQKCALARQFGAETVELGRGEDPIAAAVDFTHGRGVDGVLITASTQSDEPVHQAAVMCRQRGRIVLVGVVGLQLSRADFYEKELTFQVSCSYGPGRYDESYEQKGQDYPIGFVRWTEQRNFEAVLDLMADKKIDVAPLVTHRFPFAEALQAYAAIGAKESLGIVLEYGGRGASDAGLTRSVRTSTPLRRPAPASGEPVVGVIGAGNFTGQVLLPALKASGVRLKTIASAAGVTGTHLARKFAFDESTTDAKSMLADPEIDTVVITTRHDSHCGYVVDALEAGKRVYVEKPLCLNSRELERIEDVHASVPSPFLMVGFNRRFAPHVRKMKEMISTVREPKAMIMTANSGSIPAKHWTQSRQVGGGRIIGEACHYIDLLRFLAGSAITRLAAVQLGDDSDTAGDDKMTFTLKFADGSIGTIHYLANGHKSFPKERLEVFCAGRILQLDNFRKLSGFGWPKFKTMKLWRQDKGHHAEMQALATALRGGLPSPIPFDEIVEVTRTSFDVLTAAAPASTADNEEPVSASAQMG